MSVGGQATSRPCSRHCRWMASTSSTQIDIQTPLSAVSSPPGPKVILTPPLPRPPWAPWHRKISHAPEQTAPKVGGSPHSQPFFHPSFSNQRKLSAMFETFKIGVNPWASMPSILTNSPRGHRQDHHSFTTTVSSLLPAGGLHHVELVARS